jgi:transcriptional regulator with XRE-family HTH domain
MARTGQAVRMDAPKRPARARAAVPRTSRLRVVRTSYQDAGEWAMERVMQLAFDFGDEVKMQHGWISYAARRMGLKPNLLAQIVSGRYGDRLGLKVIQRIAKATRCTVGALVDPD